MQADCRLPCAWTSLDDQALFNPGSDHFVLLALNSRHDVAHAAGPAATELSEQRVGHTAGCCDRGLRIVEVLFEDVDQGAVVEDKAAPDGQVHRVGDRGSVEGDGGP